MLSICLIFLKNQARYAYKRYAYKKKNMYRHIGGEGVWPNRRITFIAAKKA